MPRYVRPLTFLPWLIVALFLIVVAARVGWSLFAAVFGVILAASLLFALALGHRSNRQKNG